MGHIDWIPIADMRDELKDGRAVLLWEDGRAYIAAWVETGGREVPSFWAADAGCRVTPTHFAEFNAPN